MGPVRSSAEGKKDKWLQLQMKTKIPRNHVPQSKIQVPENKIPRNHGAPGEEPCAKNSGPLISFEPLGFTEMC